MSYEKHNFKSGDKLYASQLNEMDEGIANAATIRKIEPLANEHKNMLSGYDKILSVEADGSMDNTVIISENKDLIPNGFVYNGQNISCPVSINGIHIEKLGDLYHIYGKNNSSSILTIPFGDSVNGGYIPITEEMKSVGSLVQICISNTLNNSDYLIGLDTRYMDKNKAIIMPNKKTMIGRWNKYSEYDFAIPNNAEYYFNMFQIEPQVQMDFWFYVGLFQKNSYTKQSISQSNKIDIGDKQFIMTVPYKSTVYYDMSVKDYIDNFGTSNNEFEVTPEQFGAAGDGETDDTLAIKEAILFAEENNYPLILNKKYKVTSTLEINLQKFYSKGNISYFGQGYCINFNDISHSDIEINELQSDDSGILFTATQRQSSYNKISIGSVTAQNTAISFETNGESIEYFDIYIQGRVWGGNKTLEMLADGRTWVAELHFFGGQLITKEGYQIYAKGNTQETGALLGAGWISSIRFFGTALDAELHTGVLPKGIYLDYCNFWDIISSRMESSPISTPFVINNNCTQIYVNGWKNMITDINLDNATWYFDNFYEDYDPEIVFNYCCLADTWVNIGQGRVKSDKKIYWENPHACTATNLPSGTSLASPYDIVSLWGRFPKTFMFGNNGYVKLHYNYNFWGVNEYFIFTNSTTSESTPMVFLNEDGTIKHRFTEPNKKYKVTYYAKDMFVLQEIQS